jgi:hypothetical protein
MQDRGEVEKLGTAVSNEPNVADPDVRRVRSIGKSVTDTSKLKNWQKRLPQCGFSTTNPIWIIVGLNRSLQCKKLAIDSVVNI